MPLSRKSPLKRMTLVRAKARKPRPGRLYGAELRKLREQCFDRDGGHCVDCGCIVLFNAPTIQSNAYHMAHVKAKRMGGDNLANVVTKCGDCHRKEHAGGKPVPKKGSK